MNPPNEPPSESDSQTPSRDSSIPTNLPQPAVGRLSLYHRELQRIAETGTKRINSKQLGQLVDVSPAVVRRDLSALGTIGQRGVGYEVSMLISRIGQVLGSGIQWKVILVGVGSLGNALLRYRGFERLGFELVAAFDAAPERVGISLGGVEVLSASLLPDFLAQQQPDLAILAVPADQATEVARQLTASGIRGILNFAPTTLKLSPQTAVVNVDLASELQRLAFSVQSRQ